MPESVEVLRTATQLPRSALHRKRPFPRFGCPEVFDDGILGFGGNISRATVNFEVDPTKPDALCPFRDALTMLNTNQQCARTTLPYEMTSGLGLSRDA